MPLAYDIPDDLVALTIEDVWGHIEEQCAKCKLRLDVTIPCDDERENVMKLLNEQGYVVSICGHDCCHLHITWDPDEDEAT